MSTASLYIEHSSYTSDFKHTVLDTSTQTTSKGQLIKRKTTN